MLSEPPVIAPLERNCVIEVDAFCTGCHYNLHGQVVAIDERLGFPVCRCPECGKFHPAGTGVTASSVWLRRLASILLVAWVCIVLNAAIASCLVFIALSAASVGMYEYSTWVTATGAPADFAPIANGGYGFVYKGTNIPAPNCVIVAQLNPWHNDPATDHPGLAAMLGLCTGSLTMGFIAGMLGVTLLWHWRRSRYPWLLLIPLIAAAVVMIPFRTVDQFVQIRTQCLERVASQTAVQCIGVLIGILIGRVISRTIARIVIPPKALQSLAFLWLVDGKKPPAV